MAKVGRPLRFQTEEELRGLFDEYVRGNDKISITGLAYFLGFESRQSFYDYEKREEFSYTIKRMRLYIESWYEEHLLSNVATGAIFALKNFGWSDKQEVDHTSAGEKINAAPVIQVVTSQIPLSSSEKNVSGI